MHNPTFVQKMKGYKRFARIVVTASAAVSGMRLLVLFAESYSRVSSERTADSKLLELCHDEVSSAVAASDKFRNACVQARASGASPIILKACLEAISHVFLDFSELVSSPTRLVILILFVISGVSAPFVRIVVQTFLAGMRTRTSDEESEDEEDAQQTVLLIGGPQHTKGKLNKVRRMMARAILPRDDFNHDKED